jgi:hypothetical protein
MNCLQSDLKSEIRNPKSERRPKSESLTGLQKLGSFSFINTPLQRGGCLSEASINRFSGFSINRRSSQRAETAKAVNPSTPLASTPLKRGVNEKTQQHLFNPFTYLTHSPI